MSHKNRDPHGRWRNITVAFHVSPEENDFINTRVKLSGLTKQDYITKRCQEQDVIVVPNPRVYKALKTQLGLVYAELQRLSVCEEVSDTLLETIRVIALILNGMKEE